MDISHASTYLNKSFLTILLYNNTVLGLFIKILGAVITYFTPLLPLFLLLFFMVILDQILGTIVSVKAGNKFTSNKFSRSLVKLFIYISCLSLLYLFSMEVFYNDIVCHIYIFMVFMYEFTSISESADSIMGTTLFKSIYKKIKSIGTKQLDNITNVDDKKDEHNDSSDNQPPSGTVI